jgi:phosphatidylinositol alpha-mannosyltransferase
VDSHRRFAIWCTAPGRDAADEGLVRVTRPLRIGICAPYDLGRHGGVNSHIRSQAAALRRLGHEVSVFGASSAPLADDEISLGPCVSLVIGNTETGFGADPRSWRRVRQLYRAKPFDVLHMHEPLMPLVPWFVLLQSTAPIVATFHTHRENGHSWYPRFRWLFEPFMRRVRIRLAVSEAARRTVLPHFPGEYEIVPNGIDVSRFARPAPRPPGLPPGQRHVLYVGRLEPRKGVEHLIHAMAAVQRSGNAHLVVVGDGPDREGLQAAAHRTGVAATFAGRVPDAELPGYYHAADVVCAPALGDESFGVVLLEAMAAARPIVATRIAGYAELLESRRLARLVDVGDPAGLAREINSLLNDPVQARAVGARAALAVRDYDWSAIAGRLDEIYRRVAGPPAASGLADQLRLNELTVET